MSDGPKRPRGENTTALLGLAYSALGHQIVDGVVAAGYPQRAAHSAVFAHIDLAGTRLGELARRANMTPQAMGELVDDLERRGYVIRRPDPNDRRAKLVVLTPTGLACVQAAQQTIADLESHLVDLLGEHRLRGLQRGLHDIIDLLLGEGAAEAMTTARGSVRDIPVAEVTKHDILVGDGGTSLPDQAQLSFTY